MKLGEEKKEEGDKPKDPVFIYWDVLEWGGTGFICFLIPRITGNQRNFGKLSLETVGFGMMVSVKTWELQRGRRGRTPGEN